jgi:hypothetical protein
VGGGGVAVALAVLAAFLVGKKRQSNGSGNNDDVNSTKSPAGITIHTGGTTSLDQYPPSQQAPPPQPHAVYQTGNQYRPHGDVTEASETETGDTPVIVDGATRPNLYEDTSLINQYDSSLSNATPTSYHSAATPQLPPPPVMRMSASDVEYKDQVRSVAAMPIVQPMPDDDDDSYRDEPMMVAPVMGPAITTLENSVVSAKTQASYGSNNSSSSYPRRPIDP